MSQNLFRLDGKVAIITGGAGLLGQKHAEAIASVGGLPLLLDIHPEKLEQALFRLERESKIKAQGYCINITDEQALTECAQRIVKEHRKVDILINNASMTVESNSREEGYFASFEEYPLSLWEKSLKVGLTGTFLCSKIFGKLMLANSSGVITNIASDVGVVSPDHRIYKAEGDYLGVPFNTPISYAAIKAGLINMTRYLATYWAKQGIRVNALSPAGVYNDHDEEFVKRLTQLIPLGRMASKDEYQGAIIFLCSDASKFMTGFNLVMDGGRTAW